MFSDTFYCPWMMTISTVSYTWVCSHFAFRISQTILVTLHHITEICTRFCCLRCDILRANHSCLWITVMLLPLSLTVFVWQWGYRISTSDVNWSVPEHYNAYNVCIQDTLHIRFHIHRVAHGVCPADKVYMFSMKLDRFQNHRIRARVIALK